MVREPDTDAIIPLFAELEFKGLLREFQITAQPARETNRHIVESDADLAKLVTAAGKAQNVAIDVVRDQADYTRASIVGIAIATSGFDSWYVPLRHHYLGMPDQIGVKTVLDALGPLFSDEATSKRLGHSWKESALVLAASGASCTSVSFDTELGSYLSDATKYAHTLDNIALDLLGSKLPVPPKNVERGRESWAETPVDITAEYGCSRAEAIHRSAPMLRTQLEEGDLTGLNQDLELPLSELLGEMEATGIRVDPKVLNELSVRFGAVVKEAEKACHEYAGAPFNMGSPKQLADVLFNKLELPVTKKTKTGPSTDASVLEELEGKHPIIEAIHRWREMSKLKSTYTDVLPGLINPKTGRIHTIFRQAVAATGRLSSFDPNLQNIPIRTEEGRRIRDAFVPAEGCVLMSADYSQVELRILAHLCGDPGLQKAFRDKVDIHRRTASEVLGIVEDEVTYEQRSAAKAINFGLMYGMGAFRLARDLKITRPEAQTYIDRYFERFSSVKAFMDGTIESGRELGYVTTMLGRRRYVPELRSKNFNRRAGAERAAINTPVQGTAADIIKLAMLRVDRVLKQNKSGARMLLQVHDELVFDVPTGEADEVSSVIKQEMESVVSLDVPLVVEIAHGNNWNEAH
ncbi:MAG: DNA polymerase-1 [Myxococcota bacterium]